MLALCCLVFFYLGSRYEKENNDNTKQSSAVLLEHIREVIKLATVEAQFSELYAHKEFQWFDLAPFRKSAIIRVQATVAAGIALDTSHFRIDEKTKELQLRANLEPKILYIDHQMDYYDLQQGSFNEFTAEDMSQMQQKAKELILKKAEESELLDRAKKSKESMIFILQQTLDLMSYRLVITDPAHPAIQN